VLVKIWQTDAIPGAVLREEWTFGGSRPFAHMQMLTTGRTSGTHMPKLEDALAPLPAVLAPSSAQSCFKTASRLASEYYTKTRRDRLAESELEYKVTSSKIIIHMIICLFFLQISDPTCAELVMDEYNLMFITLPVR
jgi:hypothetical protein